MMTELAEQVNVQVWQSSEGWGRAEVLNQGQHESVLQ